MLTTNLASAFDLLYMEIKICDHIPSTSSKTEMRVVKKRLFKNVLDMRRKGPTDDKSQIQYAK